MSLSRLPGSSKSQMPIHLSMQQSMIPLTSSRSVLGQGASPPSSGRRAWDRATPASTWTIRWHRSASQCHLWSRSSTCAPRGFACLGPGRCCKFRSFCGGQFPLSHIVRSRFLDWNSVGIQSQLSEPGLGLPPLPVRPWTRVPGEKETRCFMMSPFNRVCLSNPTSLKAYERKGPPSFIETNMEVVLHRQKSWKRFHPEQRFHPELRSTKHSF